MHYSGILSTSGCERALLWLWFLLCFVLFGCGARRIFAAVGALVRLWRALLQHNNMGVGTGMGHVAAVRVWCCVSLQTGCIAVATANTVATVLAFAAAIEVSYSIKSIVTGT